MPLFLIFKYVRIFPSKIIVLFFSFSSRIILNYLLWGKSSYTDSSMLKLINKDINNIDVDIYIIFNFYQFIINFLYKLFL